METNDGSPKRASHSRSGGIWPSGRGVVRKKRRHNNSDDVDQREQSLRRAARMRRGNAGEPLEQAFTARELGDEHHAGQEEINVGAFGDSRSRRRRSAVA